ncbi:hypothetical protein [Roseburia inulinivorans]
MREFDKKFIDKCFAYLECVKGEKYDITAEIFKMIKEEKEPDSALQYFLMNANSIESSEEKEAEIFFTVTEINEYEKKFGKLVEGIIDKLISQKLEEDEFYSQIWKRIERPDSEFETEKEKVFALYKIWMNRKVPYFKLSDGMKMQNEKYKNIATEKMMQVKKASFIVNSEFEQRTEKSSLLLELIEQCESEEEKVVMLALILTMSEKRAVSDLLDMLKDKCK